MEAANFSSAEATMDSAGDSSDDDMQGEDSDTSSTTSNGDEQTDMEILITKLAPVTADFTEKEKTSVKSLVADYEHAISMLASNHEPPSHPCPPVSSSTSTTSGALGNDILNALQNISVQLENYGSQKPSHANDSQSNESAHHAARQIAYWSSVFVKMCPQSSLSHISESSPHANNHPLVSCTSSSSSIPPSFTQSHANNHPLVSCASSSSSILPPATQSSLAHEFDSETIAIYQQYNSGLSMTHWLDILRIPRNVETLDDIKKVWEDGCQNCPPLSKWTPRMRRKHSSIFNQRKKIYLTYQSCDFDMQNVHSRYKETKPGKLYKLLSSKSRS